jgi:hypothetical protein
MIQRTKAATMTGAGATSAPGQESAQERPASPSTTANAAPQQTRTQGAQIAAATLLAVESRIRAAKDETELLHLVANELRKLVGGRQAIIVRTKRRGIWRVSCVSSLVLTDRETPFVRWIEGMVRAIVADRGDGEAITFELPAYVDAEAAETRGYPFGHLLWQPFRLVSDDTFAGILIARETPWTEQDRNIVKREADVSANAWQALFGARTLKPRRWFGRKTRLACAALVLGLAFVPVPMTTLAPVEIVAREPQRVTAPIDGVIQHILVDPNRGVRKGQPILRFDETTLRNRLEVAQRDMRLAEARFERVARSAFLEESARHELAQAKAEYELKKSERDYAAELLSRSVIKAERDGILVYSGKDRWLGRPVKTGERIMQIVGPNEIAAQIELPVADAIVLEQGARVRMFLDANPLSAIPARIVSEGYQAEPNSTQQLVYRLDAEITGQQGDLRIGARGTAQLQGGLVPLAFYLFRRPISAIRQHLGV